VTAELEDAAFVVAASPFGLAVSQELIDGGARVLLVGPELEPLEQAAEQLGPQALPCVAELSGGEDSARFGGVAAALLGGVDGVVLPSPTLPTGDVLEAGGKWLASFSQGVCVPLALLRGIVPLLADEGGAVLFATPTPPAVPDAGTVFCAMLDVLVDELARMLGPAIRVGRVEPTPELAEAAVRLLAPQ
jgi:NAD(P)-dependent dehydrogenase (short-subunit alcohol dehydrogenase family)